MIICKDRRTFVLLLLLVATASSHAAGIRKNQLLEQEVTNLKENLTSVWETMLELRGQLERLESEERIHHHHHHYHHYYQASNETEGTTTDETNSTNHALDHDHMFEHLFSYLGNDSSSNPHNNHAGKHHHHHHHLHHRHPRLEGNTEHVNTYGMENYHHNHNHNPNGNPYHNGNGNGYPNGNGHGFEDESFFPKPVDEDVIAQASCNFRGNKAIPQQERPKIRGLAHFKQKGNVLEIDLRLRGFVIAQHEPDQQEEHAHIFGLHVHEFGDQSNGCESAGEHYNPLGEEHGAPDSPRRHIGDLGNIQCDDAGNVDMTIIDKVAALNGTHSIIGKMLVIDEDMDDGMPANPDEDGSMATGSSARRMACCIITKLEP